LAEKATAEAWLAEAEVDLRSSRLLYDNKIYPRAIYFLQQGNEKLAKGLLIAMGMLTAKQAKGNWAIKALLGFFPKEPRTYGHRTFQSFISDVSKAIPSLDELLKHLQAGEFGPNITEFRKSVKKSKGDVRTLLLQESSLPLLTS
jgi:HEPN domain-containing protein